MGAETIVRAAPQARAGTKRAFASASKRERAFWLSLACAVLVHASLIVGVIHQRSSLPRQMGERDGDKDAISVDLVDAADLPRPTPAPVPQQSAPPSLSQPRQPAQPPAEAAAAAESAPQQKKSIERPVDKEALSPASPPSAKEKQTEAATKKKSAPQQQDASLNLDPPIMAMPPIGRSAAVARPPGVTRSGENDEFGRAVIRALRQTMPYHRGIFGRVTVRLILTDTGNLAEVRLVYGAQDSSLNQDVVFAVRQSSFPLPPVGSTVVDRTFLVTYIYN
jgi:periplasmic protein TonB